MAAFVKFQPFVQALAHGTHVLTASGGHTLKVMLTNTQPAATAANVSELTEITAKNGYVAGGNAAAITSSSQTSGTYRLVLGDPDSWVATAADDSTGIGPFRWACLYNVTSGGHLLGFWDYGTSVTLAEGESFLVDFSAELGVLTLI
jgi:hypothetical protein